MNEPRFDVHVDWYRKLIGTPEITAFITENALDDGAQLMLTKSEFRGVPMSMLVHQIIGRRKARVKVPTYADSETIIYPAGLNLEQSSSEHTARFKAQILAGSMAKEARLIDLTGGFGIDSFFFARKFAAVDYVEPDALLAWVARHNHTSLSTDNILHHTETAEQFLERAHACDAVYIDPSRRAKSGRVVQLEHCEPNILKLQDRVFELSPILLVKASPLIDIVGAISKLKFVSAIYIVSVDHECREVLFLSKRGFDSEPRISTVHLNREIVETFDFQLSSEKSLDSSTGPVRRYLYEPNPSIMKAGAFRSVAQAFPVQKIHPNSHFFSSDDLLSDFPGRIFEVISRVRARGGELRELVPDGKANVVVRNYPLSAEQLKKRLKLSDGGTNYIIGTTSLAEGKLILFSHRIR